MDHITCPFEIKSDNSNDGVITGYGSVFGNVDSYGDIVARGAFAKSIAAVKSRATAWLAMLLQHGDETSDGKMPVGIWTGMDEDERGLRLQGKLANTKRGRDVYALLKMVPRPALDGLSIGYRCTEYEMHGKGSPARRTIKAVGLVEVSLMTFPADKFARIVGVKSGLHTEPLPEPMSMKELAWSDFIELRRLDEHEPDWPIAGRLGG